MRHSLSNDEWAKPIHSYVAYGQATYAWASSLCLFKKKVLGNEGWEIFEREVIYESKRVATTTKLTTVFKSFFNLIKCFKFKKIDLVKQSNLISATWTNSSSPLVTPKKKNEIIPSIKSQSTTWSTHWRSRSATATSRESNQIKPFQCFHVSLTPHRDRIPILSIFHYFP